MSSEPLQGFMFPRSATGRSSLVPSPPWHYSGQMLTIEYRTDPAAVAELLPPPLSLADEDPGAVAVIWADWQSCSDSFDELLDPVRSQYMETFVVVRCRYRGETYSRCVYIWVDKDFAMVRGHHQGYPKKMGELYLTRAVRVGKAGPRLEPGGRFGATCAASGRRLIDATFTITGESPTAGFVNGHPMLHHRFFPAIERDGGDSLHELVTMRGYDVEVGPCYSGEATIALFDSPVEELTRLAPIEVIGGYWREVANTWGGGTTLERHNLAGAPGTGITSAPGAPGAPATTGAPGTATTSAPSAGTTSATGTTATTGTGTTATPGPPGTAETPTGTTGTASTTGGAS